jgi:hypothetical protein
MLRKIDAVSDDRLHRNRAIHTKEMCKSQSVIESVGQSVSRSVCYSKARRDERVTSEHNCFYKIFILPSHSILAAELTLVSSFHDEGVGEVVRGVVARAPGARSPHRCCRCH